MRPPFRIGDELELAIDTLAFGGRGVARHDGVVVFVAGGLPGDRVRARILKVKQRHGEAVRIETLSFGPDHVEAPCPHFGVCGGCRWQDLAYERQLEHKQAQIGDALQRIGGLTEYEMHDIVPAVKQLGYRNKLEYTWARTPGRPGAGLPRGRALGRAAAARDVPARRPARRRRARGVPRLGARASSSRPTSRRTERATCATSSCARASAPARCSASS